MCSVEFSVYSVECAVCREQRTVCSVDFAVYSVQCAVCSVHCGVHSAQYTFPSEVQGT